MNHPHNRAERLRKKYEKDYKEQWVKKQAEPNSPRTRLKALKEQYKTQEAEDELRTARIDNLS